MTPTTAAYTTNPEKYKAALNMANASPSSIINSGSMVVSPLPPDWMHAREKKPGGRLVRQCSKT